MLNKALKLIVISAVLMTSGFTQQQATISGDVTNNNILEIGNGVTVNMADGATIHNYGNIKGSGEIDGTAAAKIINYNHIVEVTENDPTCFRPTGGGSVEGTINTGNVTVTDQKADITVSFDESNKVGNTILLTTDSCDADTDKVLNMTNTDGNPITVAADISNNSDGRSVSHSLNIQGKFVLTGDQSRFNQDGTTWNVNGGSSNIAAEKAFPQVPVTVNNGSELNINAPGVVTASKNVTVNGSQLNISKNSRFRLDKGVTLWFKMPRIPWIVKAGTDLSTVDWDNPATWLLLERGEGKDSGLFALKVDEGNNKIGIMKTTIKITDTTRPDTAIGALSDITVGDTAVIKGTAATGYTGNLNADNVLKEINDLLTAGGTWKTLKEYSKEKLMDTIRTDYATTLQFDASEPIVTKYNGNAFSIKNLVIPYGVTSIGASAFTRLPFLEKIIIPNSVTTIGTNAFYISMNNAAYAYVVIPNSVTTIAGNAFSSCWLRNVIFSSNTDLPATIESSAFLLTRSTLYSITVTQDVYNKLGEESIKAKLINGGLDRNASIFYLSQDLKSVIIPESVTQIYARAFSGLSSVSNVTFLSTSALPTLFEEAFSGADTFTTVTVTQALYNSLGSDDSAIITALSNAGATNIEKVNIQ